MWGSSYDSIINDSMNFIEFLRLTGVFNFTAEVSSFTWTSDDTYTGLAGQITGNFNGYITDYNQLESRVFAFTDVEYKNSWHYEINNAWYNWDTNQWIDSWERDTSIGVYGYLEGYADINSDGSFGGTEVLENKEFSSTSPYGTWNPETETWGPPQTIYSTREYKRRHFRMPSNPQVRIHRKSDNYLLGGGSQRDRIWHGYTHASFYYKSDDPAYDGMPPNSGVRLNTRCWVYSEALVVMAYVSTGRFTDAKKTLERLALEQYTDPVTPSSHYYGGWPFSFDCYFGHVPEQDYLRNGAIAWVIWAYLIYRNKTGDTSFDSTIILGLNYMLKEQINDVSDKRYGLVRLGWNRYGESYQLDYLETTACSLEHNKELKHL